VPLCDDFDLLSSKFCPNEPDIYPNDTLMPVMCPTMYNLIKDGEPGHFSLDYALQENINLEFGLHYPEHDINKFNGCDPDALYWFKGTFACMPFAPKMDLETPADGAVEMSSEDDENAWTFEKGYDEEAGECTLTLKGEIDINIGKRVNASISDNSRIKIVDCCPTSVADKQKICLCIRRNPPGNPKGVDIVLMYNILIPSIAMLVNESDDCDDTPPVFKDTCEENSTDDCESEISCKP